MLADAPVQTNHVEELYLGTKHVVGQERARQQMAVLLDRQWAVASGALPKAGGALVGGRSGVGKTMLARAMCRLSGLPFAEVNATRYTEAGYSGLDVAQMFLPLLEEAAHIYDARLGRTVELNPAAPTTVMKRDPAELREIMAVAETGVVLLDEFDKWMLRFNHITGKKDDAIQADLLKMVEGSQEYVTDNLDEVGVLFDTGRVLILCAGAFVALQGQVAARLDVSKDDEGLWDHINQEDLVRFGVLPELAGRLATHIFLRPLKEPDLLRLLTAPGGLLEEYQRRFEGYGCRWAVSREGAQHLASLAIKAETGARAIDHICHRVFSQALFQAATTPLPSCVVFQPMDFQATVRRI